MSLYLHTPELMLGNCAVQTQTLAENEPEVDADTGIILVVGSDVLRRFAT